jgi:hypothetical protein
MPQDAADEQVTGEPFIRRFWVLMKEPLTVWDRVTRFSWIFTISYVFAILLTQAGLGWKWPDWLRDIGNAGLAVAIMIISIWYGGILTDFYSKLTGFGISEVRIDRGGADSQSTPTWIKRISATEKVQIVGTLSRGWFVIAYDNLDDLIDKDPKVRLTICLLDPFGKVWRSKIESGQDDYKKFLHEADGVFWNLYKLLTKYENRVSIRLYDSEPISCVLARGAIYLGLYLPKTSRKTIPEFTISSGSFLGSKVTESIMRIENSAPSVSAEVLAEYRNTLLIHNNTSKEEFWSDSNVSCDFCKERRGFPSEVSRRHPDLIDGSRIAFNKDHFFVIPSLGQLLDDHALIVTCSHITSSARLEREAIDQLDQIFSKLVEKAGKGMSQMFFEHGVPDDGGGYGGCGVCHCHIHSLSVPSDYRPLDALEKFLIDKGCKPERKDLGSWRQIQEAKAHSYLCVQVGTTAPTVFIFKPGERVQSQLMRQFVAKHCPGSQEEWDWRKGGKPPSTPDDHPVPPKETQAEVDREKQKMKAEEDGIRQSANRLREIFA